MNGVEFWNEMKAVVGFGRSCQTAGLNYANVFMNIHEMLIWVLVARALTVSCFFRGFAASIWIGLPDFSINGNVAQFRAILRSF